MNQEMELLPIGEMAKLTGVSIQALRYYERKNIVKPAYTNPDSGYRYYTTDQIYLIQLVLNCVNLDIPLKELADVFNAEDTEGLRGFFERNKTIAEKKAKLINASIIGYNAVLERIGLAGHYELEEVHSRAYPEKNYYLKPHGQPRKSESRMKEFLEMAQEMHGENFNRITIDDNFDEVLGLPDIGIIARYSSSQVEYFVFGEVTSQMMTENCITLPAGEYFFRQDKVSKIEDAHEVFMEQLNGAENFWIIETEEPFLSRTKISRPMFELRLVVM